MYQTRILSDKEIEEFNDKYNTNYSSILIKQENKNYFAIVDCDVKIRMYEKEVIDYFRRKSLIKYKLSIIKI